MATSDSTTAKKTTAKKTTAKRAAAKKTTAKRAAAKKSAASKAPAARSASGVVDSDAESAYVSLVLDAGAELTKSWESAGHELLSRLDAISEKHPIDVPRDVLDSLEDAARSNDVAEFLSAQQACAEALQASVERATASYTEAIDAYSTALQDLWSGHSGRHASLFGDYVADIRRRLEKGNGEPAAVAQLGWSLIAASQFASATGAGS